MHIKHSFGNRYHLLADFCFFLPLELVWSEKFHQLVMNWITRNGLKNKDKPFETSADWRKLFTFLKSILPNIPQNLGLKDFRRLAIKKIFDSEEDIGKKNF